MHQDNSKRQCLICFGELMKDVSLYHFIYHPPICLKCLRSFKIIDRVFKLDGFSIRILYEYNDFFKKLLFQYKGQYDYALKDTFLNSWQGEFKEKYRDYLIVVAPSSNQDNLKRGFCPNESIMRGINNQIFLGLYKITNYKQTENHDRTGIKKVIRIKDGHLLTNKKILLFDDVITSSNTLLICLELIKQYNPKKIEILVLSSKQINTLFVK